LYGEPLVINQRGGSFNSPRERGGKPIWENEKRIFIGGGHLLSTSYPKWGSPHHRCGGVRGKPEKVTHSPGQKKKKHAESSKRERSPNGAQATAKKEASSAKRSGVDHFSSREKDSLTEEERIAVHTASQKCWDGLEKPTTARSHARKGKNLDGGGGPSYGRIDTHLRTSQRERNNFR